MIETACLNLPQRPSCFVGDSNDLGSVAGVLRIALAEVCMQSCGKGGQVVVGRGLRVEL